MQYVKDFSSTNKHFHWTGGWILLFSLTTTCVNHRQRGITHEIEKKRLSLSFFFSPLHRQLVFKSKEKKGHVQRNERRIWLMIWRREREWRIDESISLSAAPAACLEKKKSFFSYIKEEPSPLGANYTRKASFLVQYYYYTLCHPSFIFSFFLLSCEWSVEKWRTSFLELEQQQQPSFPLSCSFVSLLLE